MGLATRMFYAGWISLASKEGVVGGKVGFKMSEEHKEKLGLYKKGSQRHIWKGGLREYHRKIGITVWEEFWHEKVPKGYEVHHVDGDWKNNDITNLALLPIRVHKFVHINKTEIPFWKYRWNKNPQKEVCHEESYCF